MLKKGLVWAAKACVAGIAAIAIVSVVSIMYFYTNVHVENPNGGTDYRWEPGQYIVDNQEGFAVNRFDENGFNNISAPNGRAIDILMMGDSQMEDTHISQKASAVSLLNTKHPSVYTYNIAISGHEIYTCFKNMEDAVRTYHPTQYVLVDTSSIELDAECMRQVVNGEYPTIPSYDKGLIYQIQKWAPGIKRVYKNMEDWITLSAAGEEPEAETVDYDSEEYVSLLNAFLGMAAAPVTRSGARLVVFFIPRTELDANGQLILNADPAAKERFQAACAENGIVFVDLSDDFRALYEEERRLPYGFINTRVGRGHLNEAGHRRIADRLSEALALPER